MHLSSWFPQPAPQVLVLRNERAAFIDETCSMMACAEPPATPLWTDLHCSDTASIDDPLETHFTPESGCVHDVQALSVCGVQTSSMKCGLKWCGRSPEGFPLSCRCSTSPPKLPTGEGPSCQAGSTCG